MTATVCQWLESLSCHGGRRSVVGPGHASASASASKSLSTLKPKGRGLCARARPHTTAAMCGYPTPCGPPPVHSHPDCAAVADAVVTLILQSPACQWPHGATSPRSPMVASARPPSPYLHHRLARRGTTSTRCNASATERRQGNCAPALGESYTASRSTVLPGSGC